MKVLYNKAQSEKARREVIGTFSVATRVPHAGALSAPLLGIVWENTREIVEFYCEVMDGASFEILQSLEHDVLWLYRHNRLLSPEVAGNPENARTHAELIRTFLGFRARINANHEFVIYKTLVGFESVFPPAWDDENFKHAEEEAYRERKLRDFVEEVTDTTADRWLERLKRCARTESNDLATFPVLVVF